MRTLGLAVGLLLAAPGLAAGAAPTPGDYGGGGFHAGGMATWMWARLAPDGTVRVGGRTQLGCGLGWFDGQTTLAPDGSFRFSRTRRVFERGHVVRSVVTVAGRFDGALGVGTVRARVRDRLPSGGVERCRTRGGGRAWKVHLRPGAGAPAAPQPGGAYLGLTSQPAATPKPFVLRVNGRGTRVGVAIFDYVRTCRRAGVLRLNNVTPGGRIRAGGTFALRERFTLRYRGGIRERFRVRIDGQFTAGGVAGALRVSTVVRRRGRTIDRCDTRPLTFSALL